MSIDAVVVATSAAPADDPIEDVCATIPVPCFRGSELDVLDRVYRAAVEHEATTVVRITGDCPFIDPAVIDDVLAEFATRDVDFAANRLPPPHTRTFPVGLDVEVASIQALETAWRRADEPHHREHVMPYLYEIEGRFRVYLHHAPVDLGDVRITLDTFDDLALLRAIADRMGGRDDFGWFELIDLLEREPELRLINAGVQQKSLDE